MSDEAPAAKKGKRYVVIPWTTPEGKEVEKVILARDVTAEEAYGIIGEMLHGDDTYASID